MIEKQTGIVEAVTQRRQGVQEIQVRVGERVRPAMNYVALTGEVEPGDQVILNTTAVRLRLGTGGYDFVVAVNPERLPPVEASSSEGLMVKLRYTPLQFATPAAEEQYPEALEGDLAGTPVVAFALHSQLVPILAGIRKAYERVGGWESGSERGERELTTPNPELRTPNSDHHSPPRHPNVVYIMTDSAALPLGFSRLVGSLHGYGWLTAVVTIGQAFGGDLEAVNVYSAMLLAKNQLSADVILVGQGPGNTGTHSRWGFSSIDQGIVLNAAGTLSGIPIAALRVSFADPRERHQGVSHHSLTVLSRVALVPCIVPVPILPPEQAQIISEQLMAADLPAHHQLQSYDAGEAFAFMLQYAPAVRTMLRGPQDDPAFFLAGCAAGMAAVERSAFGLG